MNAAVGVAMGLAPPHFRVRRGAAVAALFLFWLRWAACLSARLRSGECCVLDQPASRFARVMASMHSDSLPP
jgi:hypothetical protein